MKISIHKETVAPMTAWLKAAREQGTRDEKALREILSMPDYGVEFQRYSEPNLPVCGISFEEELVTLDKLGTWGAILGKALYTGRLDLARAIRLAQG